MVHLFRILNNGGPQQVREKLLEAKAALQMQMDRIDDAMKFFEEHPEMEHILVAMTALQSVAYRTLG
jgi:hypothetical protein